MTIPDFHILVVDVPALYIVRLDAACSGMCKFFLLCKLNPDKTEFILIGTKTQRDKFKKYFPTKLLDQDVTSDSARNLGVEFDKDFNFKKHISKVCRSCYYHIRDLRRFRRCLTAALTN